MATMSTRDHLISYDDIFADQDTLLCFTETSDEQTLKNYSSPGVKNLKTLLPQAEELAPTNYGARNHLEGPSTLSNPYQSIVITKSSDMTMKGTSPPAFSTNRINTSPISEPTEASQCSQSEILPTCNISATIIMSNNTTETSYKPTSLVEEPRTLQSPIITHSTQGMSVPIPTNLFNCSEELYQFHYKKCSTEIQKSWDVIRLKREKFMNILNKYVGNISNDDGITPKVSKVDERFKEPNNGIKSHETESIGKITKKLRELGTLIYEKQKLQHDEPQSNSSTANSSDNKEATTMVANKQTRLKKMKKPKKKRVETERPDKDTWMVNNNGTQKQTVITLKRKPSCCKESSHQNMQNDESSAPKTPRILNDSTMTSTVIPNTSYTHKLILQPEPAKSQTISNPIEQNNSTKTKEQVKRARTEKSAENNVPNFPSSESQLPNSSTQQPTSLIMKTPPQENDYTSRREVQVPNSNSIEESVTELNQNTPLEITVKISGSVQGAQTQSQKYYQSANLYKNTPYLERYQRPSVDRRVDMHKGLRSPPPAHMTQTNYGAYANVYQIPVHNPSYHQFQSQIAPKPLKPSPYPNQHQANFSKMSFQMVESLSNSFNPNQLSGESEENAGFNRNLQMSQARPSQNPQGYFTYADNMFTPPKYYPNSSGRNMAVNSTPLSRDGRQRYDGYLFANYYMPPQRTNPPQYKF